MDHYIPKRRVSVSLWSTDGQELAAHVFLDLDPSGSHHQTILSKLNETSRFLPVALGEERLPHLVLKSSLVRVTAGEQVLQADMYTRGFQPWREAPAEVWLEGGARLQGCIWMPLERPSQRVSDFMNQLGWSFFVMLTSGGVQIVNSEAVVRMALPENAGAQPEGEGVAAASGFHHTLPMSRPMPMPVFDPTLGLGSAARR